MSGDRDGPEVPDLDELLEELAMANETAKLLKQENVQLRREAAAWHKRAERAELECAKWKATAGEWRAEFMKRRGRSG